MRTNQQTDQGDKERSIIRQSVQIVLKEWNITGERVYKI